jgi:acetoin utilization protein AcuB
MLVGDLMTSDPRTVDADQPVADAIELMADLHIRHLPVLRDGELVGLVSDRDLRTHAPPDEVAMEDLRTTAQLMDRPVAEIMSPAPQTIAVGDTLGHAIDLMLEWRFGALCVVVGGRLVGILSQLDVMRALRPLASQLDTIPPRSSPPDSSPADPHLSEPAE